MADLQSEPPSSHKYCFERERLKLFKNMLNRDIDPNTLEKAGFYNIGQLNKTRCFHCNIAIYRWNKKNHPNFVAH